MDNELSLKYDELYNDIELNLICSELNEEMLVLSIEEINLMYKKDIRKISFINFIRSKFSFCNRPIFKIDDLLRVCLSTNIDLINAFNDGLLSIKEVFTLEKLGYYTYLKGNEYYSEVIDLYEKIDSHIIDISVSDQPIKNMNRYSKFCTEIINKNKNNINTKVKSV